MHLLSDQAQGPGARQATQDRARRPAAGRWRLKAQRGVWGNSSRARAYARGTHAELQPTDGEPNVRKLWHLPRRDQSHTPYAKSSYSGHSE